MTLHAWIKKEGPQNVSYRLRVTTTSIYHWLNRDILPKARTMQQIVKETKGEVSYQEMIEDFLKHNPTNR